VLKSESRRWFSFNLLSWPAVTAEDVGKGALLFPSLLPFPPPPHVHSLPALHVTCRPYAPINLASGSGRAIQGKPDNGKEQELQPILPQNVNEKAIGTASKAKIQSLDGCWRITMRMENAEVWCVVRRKTTVTLRASTKSEPTIDFCM